MTTQPQPDPAQRCDNCAPEFGCWNAQEKCRKQPAQPDPAMACAREIRAHFNKPMLFDDIPDPVAAIISRTITDLRHTLDADRDAVERERDEWKRKAEENEQLAEISQALLEIVEAHALERDDSLGPEDLLKSHYADRDALAARVRELTEENANWKKEIEANLAQGPSVRVREGGGPENLAASLAVTMASLRAQLAKADEANKALQENTAALHQRNVDLVAQLAKAKEDSERLDWLQATNQQAHYCGIFRGGLLSRAAIDQARQPATEEPPSL